MIRRILVLSLPLLAFSAAFAQLKPGTAAKLDEVFAPWNKSDAPGGVVGVIKDGKLVYAKGFGMANLEHSIPLSSHSVVDVGSVTKHFTSTAILMLEDEGKLKLDDPITNYLPDIPTFGKTITIRHILTHTSGIRDYLTCLAIAGWELGEPIKERRALEMIKRQRAPNFSPQASWNYSNTGYFLAGLIVRKVSGLSLANYLKSKVFTPLGMNSTRLYDDGTQVVKDRAESYRVSPLGWTRLTSPPSVVGDGGLLTTVEDFAKWDEELRKDTLGIKGGHLKRLAQIENLSSGASTHYGLGIMEDTLGGVKRYQHGGDWLGYNAQYAIFPEKNLSVFCFGNDGTQNGKSLNDKAARVILEIPEPVSATAEKPWTDAAFKAVEGEWTLGPMTLKIFQAEGKKMAQATAQPAFELFSNGDDKIFLKVVPVVITRKKAGADGKWEEAELEQETPGGKVKLPVTRAKAYSPTDEALSAWTGDWYCPDLKATLTLAKVGKELSLTMNGDPESARFTLSSETAATVGGLKLTLKPGAKPTLIADTGRANGLEFFKL